MGYDLKISKLRFKNFKHFKDGEIDFNNGINALVGENNAGKTSILLAIESIFSANYDNEIKYDFPSLDQEGTFTTHITLEISLSAREWP